MTLIWFCFLIQFLILVLIKPIVTDFQLVSLITILIGVGFTVGIILVKKYPLRDKFVFISAYLIRVITLLWDIFAREIYVLPNSGADTEMFYNFALSASESMTSLLDSDVNIYSRLLGFFIHLIGDHRIFLQYINVLFGLTTVMMLYKILKMLNLSRQSILFATIILSFFPNSIILSSILLREAIPAFFVVWSAYYFIIWFQKEKRIYIVMAFILISIASIFHTGVIGVMLGYVYIFLFYNFRNRQIRFSFSTVTASIIIVVLIYIVFIQYSHIFLRKFNNFNSIDDIYLNTNKRRGSSVYLTGLIINNPIQFLLYGPIKSMFFLVSPLPMNWRGLGDVFVFATDSILYLWIIISIIKNMKQTKYNSIVFIGLCISIVSASFIFGLGVNNAGTAMRHRQKIVSLFLIVHAIIDDNKFKKKVKRINSLGNFDLGNR